MVFEFATATRIVFGTGTLQQVPAELKPLGTRVFVVTGQSPERSADLLSRLEETGIDSITYTISSEPTIPMAIAAVAEARSAQCDTVIGLGGGSAIDMGKVVAVLLTNDGDMISYLEVVGEGRPIQNRPAPYIAIPTTAGTGAEVTRNAVLGVPEKKRKVSMRSPMMLPALAVVDPELTYSMPPSVSAMTGLDALTQVIEPFVSHLANPLTDGICREGIRRVARSLKRVCSDGQHKTAREDMALASLFGGLALANAKLGAVHGFAGPLGGEIAAPHGAICGRLLPYVVEANLRALNERDAAHPSRIRFAELGPLLTGEQNAGARQAIAWLHGFCRDLKTSPLSEYGLQKEDIPRIAEKAGSSSSMKGNPIELTRDELIWILEQAI